jgi:hypothetical protein
MACVVLVSAVGLTAQSEQKLTGYLVDSVCAGNHAHKPGYKEQHDKACNLMPGCVKSGYSLIMPDNSVLAFDAKGAEQALTFIKATNKEKDLKVTVTGTVTGKTIAVKNITLD